MLTHLIGKAQMLLACSAMWVSTSAVDAREGHGAPLAGIAARISVPPKTPLVQPSKQGTTAGRDDQLFLANVGGSLDAVAWSWERMIIAAAAMVGAVLLSLPLAFIYLRTRPAREFDSSVLFSIVFLAATIAGIFVAVQGSVARALSLAGVVSAVRFRSSLKDSNDAVYILGAIAVGLAAGSNALDVGVVISALLSLTLILLWKIRFRVLKLALLPTDDTARREHLHGNPESQGSRHGHHHGDAETRHGDPGGPDSLSSLHGHHHRDSDPIEVSATQSSAPTATDNVATPVVGSGLSPQAPARSARFVLETEHFEQTRLLVETFLDRETKSWSLEGTPGNGSGTQDKHIHGDGVATLTYVVRFRKRDQPDAIAERLRAVGLSSHFSVHMEAITEVLAQEDRLLR